MTTLCGWIVPLGLLVGCALGARIAQAEPPQPAAVERQNGGPPNALAPASQPDSAGVDLYAVKLAPGVYDASPRRYHWGSGADPYHTWQGYQAK